MADVSFESVDSSHTGMTSPSTHTGMTSPSTPDRSKRKKKKSTRRTRIVITETSPLPVPLKTDQDQAQLDGTENGMVRDRSVDRSSTADSVHSYATASTVKTTFTSKSAWNINGDESAAGTSTSTDTREIENPLDSPGAGSKQNPSPLASTASSSPFTMAFDTIAGLLYPHAEKTLQGPDADASNLHNTTFELKASSDSSTKENRGRKESVRKLKSKMHTMVEGTSHRAENMRQNMCSPPSNQPQSQQFHESARSLYSSADRDVMDESFSDIVMQENGRTLHCGPPSNLPVPEKFVEKTPGSKAGGNSRTGGAPSHPNFGKKGGREGPDEENSSSPLESEATFVSTVAKDGPDNQSQASIKANAAASKLVTAANCTSPGPLHAGAPHAKPPTAPRSDSGALTPTPDSIPAGGEMLIRSTPMARMRNEHIKKAAALSPEESEAAQQHQEEEGAVGYEVDAAQLAEEKIASKHRKWRQQMRMAAEEQQAFLAEDAENDGRSVVSSNSARRDVADDASRMSSRSKTSDRTSRRRSTRSRADRGNSPEQPLPPKSPGRRRGGSGRERSTTKDDYGTNGGIGLGGPLSRVIPPSPVQLLQQMMQKNCSILEMGYDSEYSSDDSDYYSDYTYDTDSIFSGDASATSPAAERERGRSRARPEDKDHYTNAAKKKAPEDAVTPIETEVEAASVAAAEAAILATTSLAKNGKTGARRKNPPGKERGMSSSPVGMLEDIQESHSRKSHLPSPTGEGADNSDVNGRIAGMNVVVDSASSVSGGDKQQVSPTAKSEASSDVFAATEGPGDDEEIAEVSAVPTRTAKEKQRKDKRNEGPEVESFHVGMNDKEFVKSFIEVTTKQGVRLMLHQVQNSQCYTQPVAVDLFLRVGAVDRSSTFRGPTLCWLKATEANDASVAADGSATETPEEGSVYLFDIISVEKAGVMNLHSYPFAIPGNSFFVSINNGDDILFEATSDVEQRHIIHGLRWVVARLAYNLISGNKDVCCELLTFDGTSVHYGHFKAPPLGAGDEELASKAMDDVTNQLVDESISRVEEI